MLFRSFTLLGYGAGASAEEIKKTEDEIEQLEKNLKYAKMEQSNFNDTTSELTRMKNADKIAEYSDALQVARSKLDDMATSGKSTKGSIEDLQNKFAEGGESAQEATQEVLEALFSMEDPVAQNAAGVGLFGTKWEDLGIEGVKALMDVNGNITTSKETLEEVDKIKFNSVERRTESLGRKFKTEITQPIFDKAMPKLESAMDYVSNNMDHIIDIIKKVGEAMKIEIGRASCRERV